MRKSIFAATVLLISLLSIHTAFYSGKGEENIPAMLSLNGQVVDKDTGEALAGVLVSIEEAGDKLYTDFEGRFKVEGLMPGNYNLNTSMISYDDIKIKLEMKVNQGEPVKIMLNQATFQ